MLPTPWWRRVLPGTTWNPSDKGSGITLSNGNLTATKGTTGWQTVRAVHGVNTSGGDLKRYYEVRVDQRGADGAFIFGIATTSANLNNYLGRDAHGYGVQPGFIGNGFSWHNAASHLNNNSVASGDVFGVVVSVISGAVTLDIYKDGNTWDGWTGLAASTWYPAAAFYNTGTAGILTATFAEENWRYEPPDGCDPWGP